MFGKNPELSVSPRRRVLAALGGLLAAAALSGCAGHNEQSDIKEPRVEPGCNPVSVQLLDHGARYYSIPRAPGNESGLTDYFELADDAETPALIIFHAIITPEKEAIQEDTPRTVHTDEAEGDINEKFPTGGYVDLDYRRDGEKIGLIGKVCTGITSSEHIIFGQPPNKII